MWGPRSRIALRDFKILNGLSSDDEWDNRTQVALFDDRCQVASIGYVPPDPNVSTTGLFRRFQPSPGLMLHPLNREDAATIQGRLFELGYYRKSGDGTWGAASQSALRDFKVANGFSPDDTWDRAVESRLNDADAIPASRTPFGDWVDIGGTCSDATSRTRLTISSTEIVTGTSYCRMEQPLAHIAGIWTGAARCMRGRTEVRARVSLKLIGSRLIDQSIVGEVPNSDPPRFERCR